MELKQLESYVAVVEYGSFTKAAEKLFISQPTISIHIQMLETELQTTLLERHTKRLEVTERGRELYECASDMLGLRDRLLKSWSEEEQKTIHIGSSTIPSSYVLPEVLPLYKKQYPETLFAIHQGDSQEILEGLYAGSYQVGLVGMQVEEDGINCIPFYEDRLVLITANTPYFAEKKSLFDENKGKKIIRQLLLTQPMIVREKGSGSKKYADKALRKLDINEEELNILARLNDSEAIKNMVIEGMGIAIISEKAVRRGVKNGQLIAFPLPKNIARRNLNIIYREKNLNKCHERQFIDFIIEYYKNSERHFTE